jgi:hypothetical protein
MRAVEVAARRRAAPLPEVDPDGKSARGGPAEEDRWRYKARVWVGGGEGWPCWGGHDRTTGRWSKSREGPWREEYYAHADAAVASEVAAYGVRVHGGRSAPRCASNAAAAGEAAARGERAHGARQLPKMWPHRCREQSLDIELEQSLGRRTVCGRTEPNYASLTPPPRAKSRRAASGRTERGISDVAAPFSRAKPRMAYGMRAHGAEVERGLPANAAAASKVAARGERAHGARQFPKTWPHRCREQSLGRRTVCGRTERDRGIAPPRGG